MCSRLKPFNLLVAQNHDGLATGELYWDDGEYVGKHYTACSDVTPSAFAVPLAPRRHV